MGKTRMRLEKTGKQGNEKRSQKIYNDSPKWKNKPKRSGKTRYPITRRRPQRPANPNRNDP